MRLKPYGGGNRLIVINDANQATLEAQNALLKILEEPPPKTYIILTSNSNDQLLPTVISRCQIIAEKGEKPINQNQDIVITKKLISQIIRSSPAERIAIAQKYYISKEEVEKILDSILIFLEETLYQNKDEKFFSALETARLIKKIEAAKKYLKANVNYKAVLDILFLGFPQK